MPEKTEYQFNKWGKSMSPAFVFYGDVEALLLPDGTHQPIMAAFLLLPHERTGQSPSYHSFTGRECIQSMLKKMEELAIQSWWFLETNGRKVMQPLSSLQQQEFTHAEKCYLCQNSFLDETKKCRDHDHLTGQYRGAAC